MAQKSAWEVLGETVVDQLNNVNLVGFDVMSLVEPAAGLAKAGMDAKAKDDAAKKLVRDQASALNKATAADNSWANAEAILEMAKKSNNPSQIDAATVSRDAAQHDAAGAGAGLSEDSIAKRCSVAHDALTSAASDAQGSPKDAMKQAKMHAWQKVSAACNASGSDAGSGSGGSKGGSHGGESFWTQKHAGVPTWGWVVGVPAAVTVVGLLVHSLFGKKRR